MKLFLLITVFCTSLFASRIYLTETNEIVAFRQDGLYHFIGKIDRLTYNPEKNQDFLMFTMVDQPRSFSEPFLVNKNSLVFINLLTQSIGKTKVYIKTSQGLKGLKVEAVQLIDPKFE